MDSLEACKILGFKDLNFSLDHLKNLFDQITMNYKSKSDLSLAPVTSKTRESYQRLVQAYNVLKAENSKKNFIGESSNFLNSQNAEGDSEQNITFNLKNFLLLVSSNKTLKFLVKQVKPCNCITLCQCKTLEDLLCKKCLGLGWHHYCELCQGTGSILINSSEQVKLPPKLQKSYHLTLSTGKKLIINLKPQENLSIEGQELNYDVFITRDDYFAGIIKVSPLSLESYELDLSSFQTLPFTVKKTINLGFLGIKPLNIKVKLAPRLGVANSIRY